jgi:hypothetical protein
MACVVYVFKVPDGGAAMLQNAIRATVICAAFLGATASLAQDIEFGDDSSEFARDGECDDRRFRGSTMAGALSVIGIGRDATDCQRGYEAGTLDIWDPAAAQAATDCTAIAFGDDTSDFANDGQCDDIRFEGIGAAALLIPLNTFRDASDCAWMCRFGMVALRDYD